MASRSGFDKIYSAKVFFLDKPLLTVMEVETRTTIEIEIATVEDLEVVIDTEAVEGVETSMVAATTAIGAEIVAEAGRYPAPGRLLGIAIGRSPRPNPQIMYYNTDPFPILSLG